MNALFLIILLFGLCSLYFIMSDRDIFSPSVIICASYLVGALIVFLHNGFSEYDISMSTVAIIFLFVVIFGIGFYFFNIANLYTNSHVAIGLPQELPLGNYFCYICTFITILSVLRLIFVYQDLTGTVFSMRTLPALVWHGKHTAQTMNFSNGLFWGAVLLFADASQYIFAYSCLYDKIIKNERISNKKIAPILIACICKTLQGSRIWLIQFIIYVLFLAYLFSKTVRPKQNNFQKSFHTMVRIIKAVVLFWFLFSLMGKLKFQYYESPFDTFYAYTGASYLVFEVFEAKKIPPVMSFSKAYTLKNFYLFLNHFGFNILLTNGHGDDSGEYASTGDGLVSNIIPGFGRYYFDFGYVGMSLISLFLGVLCGKMYQNLKKGNNSSIFIFLYAIIVQSCALQFISEQFLIYMLSTSFLIPFFEFYIVKVLSTKEIKHGIKLRFHYIRFRM